MATFAALSADVAALGGLTYADESDDSDRWAKGGLRLINRAGAWEWLHAHTTFALTGGTYAYAFSTIASSLFRIDTKSIRYGSTYLDWYKSGEIDEILGPDWKDADAAEGTPAYVTRVGNSLWLAQIPGDTFVAANANAAFYYWRNENYTGTLYLPEDFYDIAVDASLAFGFTQEDDPRAESMMARFQKIHVPEMRATKMDMGQRDRMHEPGWMRDSENIVDGYGDGPVR